MRRLPLVVKVGEGSETAFTFKTTLYKGGLTDW